MKIVYCIRNTATPGGMERVLSTKANALAKLGYEITIVTTDQRGREPFFSLDKRVNTLDLAINFDHIPPASTSRWRRYLAKRAKTKVYVSALKVLLRDMQPDIAISMGYAERAYLPRIVSQGTECIYEIHGSMDGIRNLNELTKGRMRYELLGKYKVWRFVRDLQGYAYNVHLTQEDASSYPSGHIPNQIIIPNPLPISMDTPPSPCSAKRMVVMGRLDHQKNVGELVEIWARVQERYPDWELAIYGDGYMRGRIEEQIRSLSLASSVKLYGKVSDPEVAYQSASALLMTSYAEGLPMVMLEAQALGLPIISYDFRCGPREVIQDAETGYIIPWGNKEAFAGAIQRLIEDEELRREMGAKARQASSRFAPERVIKQWVELFEQIQTNKK